MKSATQKELVVGIAAGEVARITGIPYSTLNLWARSGLLTPSVSSGTGKGQNRLYSQFDVAALRDIARLRRAGMPMNALRAFRARYKNGNLSEYDRWLVICGNRVRPIQNRNDLGQVLHSMAGCVYLVVDLRCVGAR